MAFLNCPIELLKVKLQTQNPNGFINTQGTHEPAVSRIKKKKEEGEITRKTRKRLN